MLVEVGERIAEVLPVLYRLFHVKTTSWPEHRRKDGRLTLSVEKLFPGDSA